MKLIIIIVVCVVVGIALLVGVVGFIGASLPKAHVASRSVLLHKSQQQVYSVARDFAAMPTWRADLKSVDLEPQPDGRLHFRESGKQGTVNFELVEDVPAERMVTRILDKDLGYSGKWTYVFTSENGVTRLTITEDGEVSNVFFRFMSRYVFGHTATLDSYLSSLATRFGEPSTPR
jgi:uncharacterized protein YndB with AHSA1/START domain